MNKKVKKILNKKNKSKVICLTAYSKNVASILDKHCDLVLVGDSLGNVLYNFKSTKEVTLDTMINHSKSVRLGVKKSLMVVDMPFNTYRTPKAALKNAKLILKKTTRFVYKTTFTILPEITMIFFGFLPSVSNTIFLSFKTSSSICCTVKFLCIRISIFFLPLT